MSTNNKTTPPREGNILTLNGKEYNISELSQEAQQSVFSIKIAENEINRLKQQLALAETAYNTYRRALIAAMSAKE